jgi:ectoine hydroxylase-related dioxygenase (phytanoyl-CoA dioxygenase family)
MTNFAVDGYHIVPKMLARVDCEAIIRLLEKYAKKDFPPILDIEKALIKQDFDALKESVFHDAHLVYQVALCIPSPEYMGAIVHFKRPGTKYAAQAWSPHQDNSYIKVPSGRHVSAILVLQDTDKMNGGLYVYPGTHNLEVLPYKPTKSLVMSPGNEVEVPRGYKKRDLKFKQGDLYIQHGNLIHGSYPNKSKRSREHLGMIYVTFGTKISKGRSRA